MQLLDLLGGGEASSLLLGAPPQTCALCNDIPEDPVVSKCQHVFCSQCLSSQAAHLFGEKTSGKAAEEEDGVPFLCPGCTAELRHGDVFSRAALLKAQGLVPAATAAAAPAAAAAPGEGADGWQSSSKVDQLLELLEQLRKENGGAIPARPGQGPGGGRNKLGQKKAKSDRLLVGSAFKKLPPPPTAPLLPAGMGGSSGAGSEARKPHKVIVFSQWTSMLDLIEIPLAQRGFNYRRLDGTMSVAARDRAVQDFVEKPEVLVMVMSLKAAALGLNLVCANHVVLLDLWWNPTVEEQAIDRAHRIGQTREVLVHRLTVKDTVEDRILALQEKKRQLVRSALGEDSAGSLQQGGPKLSVAELEALFFESGS